MKRKENGLQEKTVVCTAQCFIFELPGGDIIGVYILLSCRPKLFTI